MLVNAAEGEGGRGLAEAVDHAVAGNMFGVGIDVQGVADDAAPARVTREHGNLSVGRNPAVGNLFDHVIYQLKGIFHGLHFFTDYLRQYRIIIVQYYGQNGGKDVSKSCTNVFTVNYAVLPILCEAVRFL